MSFSPMSFFSLAVVALEWSLVSRQLITETIIFLVRVPFKFTFMLSILQLNKDFLFIPFFQTRLQI
jgi:hypothetical protein